MVATEAERLAEVWSPESVAALLRTITKRAIEARDSNLDGELSAIVGLSGGQPVRMKVRSEEAV